MPSALGAFLSALGEGGMNIASFKAKEKNDALLRALEEDKFNRNLDLQRTQLEHQGRQLDLQTADRADGRELQRVAQGTARAQNAAANYGGVELDPNSAAVKDFEEFLPIALQRTPRQVAVGGVKSPVPSYDIEGKRQEKLTVRETQPVALRTAAMKQATDAAKLVAARERDAAKNKIAEVRNAIAQQGVNISGARLKQYEEQLRIAEKRVDDDYNIAVASIEQRIYSADLRASSGGDEDGLARIIAESQGRTYTAPVRPGAPTKPTVPAPRQGGTAPLTELQELVRSLSAYTQKGGGR